MNNAGTPTTAQRAPARISVLMPVYNAGGYLPEAIESILKQTYTDFILYVLNDGSTDGSLDTLNEYAKDDSRVRVVSHENRGLIATLNEGIALTDTEFVARMDSDDVAVPERFALQVAYLDAHPECVAVGGDVLLIDSDGMPLCVMDYPPAHDDILRAQRDCLNQSVIAHPAAMIRKSAIDRIEGYRSEYVSAEDIDFFLRLGEVGALANLPQVLLRYRQHLQSIGYAKRQQQSQSAIAAAEAAIARRGDDVGDYRLDRSFVAQTAQDTLYKWIWWAIHGGNVATARKHAWRLVRTEPFSMRSWRAFYCAWRGH